MAVFLIVLSGNVAGNPKLRLLLPVVWGIPRKFPAFSYGLCTAYTDIAKDMSVQCSELAALMCEGKEMADPCAQ